MKKKKGKAGRPTKYNDETILIIYKALREGMSRRDACIAAGISEDTFANWLRDKSYFSENIVKKAEYELKHRNIQIIQKAARVTWQAAAWWLERKHKDEFSLKTETELSGGLDNTNIVIKDEIKKAGYKDTRDFIIDVIKGRVRKKSGNIKKRN